MSRLEAATLALVMVALGVSERALGTGLPAMSATSIRVLATAAASGFPIHLTRPWANRPFPLHLSVPGRDGHEVWGASLALPTWWPFTPPVEKAGRKDMAFQPTPELEIGLRSLGKAMGGAVQYIGPMGVRLGAGLFFNKLAPGTPPARQLMVVLQFRF